MFDGPIIVTGGAGFIGSCVIRNIIRNTDHSVVNVDKLTYAATPEALEECVDSPRYSFEKADICDIDAIERIFDTHRPGAVMHLAAESHVDRSIDGPISFVETNLRGTSVLLEAARRRYARLDDVARENFRFHHISTDEVFGTLKIGEPPFDENSPYRPNSPYAATKAGSDHLVRAWAETYDLPIVISNCSNNYGPWQFPEKLIPVMISKACDFAPMPIYGDGGNIRDWLHVEDHAEALLRVLTKGRPGATYAIGGDAERSNIEVARLICRRLDLRGPKDQSHESLITFVTDRPGHDFRYAINARRMREELGWRPSRTFEDGLADTIDWFLDHEDWWRNVLQSRYSGERLGLSVNR